MDSPSGALLSSRIRTRAAAAECPIEPLLAESLAQYLELLARWNRSINLSGFKLDVPSDEAIDRLIVEALLAARKILPTDRFLLDVGSGGGSPAIPLKLAVPRLDVVLIESKSRKAAFLREAVRQLEMSNVSVEASRLENLVTRSDLQEAADLVTIRAVKTDAGLLATMQGFLRPGGRVFYFGVPKGSWEALLPAGTPAWGRPALVSLLHGHLGILQKPAGR